MIDTKIYPGQCDMLYWFLPYNSKTGGEMIYLEYKFHVTRWLTSKYI